MNDSHSSDQISDEIIMERMFSFCNEAMHTITLQFRRLQTDEPEDSEFRFRKLADLRFFILSLDRLEKSVKVMRRITKLSSEVDKALNKFCADLPYLSKVRNIGEHIDKYSIDRGNNSVGKGGDFEISRKSLQVVKWNEKCTHFLWFDEDINIIKAKNVAMILFTTIRDIKNNFLTDIKNN